MPANPLPAEAATVGSPDPKISIVISAYNRPAPLVEAVDSALRQTYPNKEVIVVDDCSPVDLKAALAQFGDRILYHRKETGSGPSGTRNVGVKIASGDYVAFLDDDDIWLPNKLEVQLVAMGTRDASVCGFSVLETGRLVVRPVTSIDTGMLLYGNKFAGTTGFMAKRSRLLAEPFDETLRWGEDWDIYVRYSQKEPLVYVPQPLFQRRTGNNDSITKSLKKVASGKEELFIMSLKKHRKLLGETIFRRRVAGIKLSNLKYKDDKAAIIWDCMKSAGALPTIWWLAYKTMRGDARV
ncbi:glycosyltransferase family 2 protein [Dongia rigui]|uniref:Glycosyltransferase family A protein n=1 Tax=Dongia rigui TaxID=940149 RepID=A0ABU5DYZ8_9PROT|nr:glycosyltransferase family A protein [Dongia rigui]MDY0872556.1 glycosyltransferase family A protein [Dongia rigui]